MSLGKLLSAGKSFLGGKGKIAYRKNKRIYVPKFNAEKNPFLPWEMESVAEKPAISAGPAMAAAAPSPARPASPAESKRGVRWAHKLNPFRAAADARPSAPVPVQTELSLEAVKVVHNDLADADIEMVPVKSRTVAQPEAPMLPPARSSWELLGEHLVNQE